jgi:ankyrin repeat protein
MESRLRAGESGVSREMVSLGLNLDYAMKEATALTVAAGAGNISECIALLDAGAGIDVPGVDRKTALHVAIDTGSAGLSVGLLQLLVDRGAGLEVLDKHRCTPLHLAALRGHARACNILLRAGASPKAYLKNGATALHLAAAGDSPEVALALVKEGADVTASDMHGRMPLHWAAGFGKLPVCRTLVECGASPSHLGVKPDWSKSKSPLLTAMQDAVRSGEMEVARYFVVECGEDLAQRTPTGRTLSQVAAKNQQMRDFVRSLKTEVAISDVAEDVSAPDSGLARAQAATFGAL